MNGRSVTTMMTHERDTDLRCFVNTGQQYENIKITLLMALFRRQSFSLTFQGQITPEMYNICDLWHRCNSALMGL